MVVTVAVLCAVLYYTAIYNRAELCNAMLCSAVLCCAVLYYTAISEIILNFCTPLKFFFYTGYNSCLPSGPYYVCSRLSNMFKFHSQYFSSVNPLVVPVISNNFLMSFVLSLLRCTFSLESSICCNSFCSYIQVLEKA